MTKQQIEHLENLTKITEAMYGHLHPDEVDKIAATYETSVTEMFEVTKVKNNTLELSHFFEDAVYAPVVVEPPLQVYFKPGDTILLTMGRKHGVWYLIWVSPPYWHG
jgi:hypothetical protein